MTAGADNLQPALAAELKDAQDDPLRIKDLLEPLRRYSLIGLDHDADVYTVHRLVQEVIRGTIRSEEHAAWINRVLAVIDRSLWMLNEHQWLSWAPLIPHAYHALQLAERISIEDKTVGSVLIRLGDYLVHTGQYEGAEAALTSAVRILDQTYGPEHPKTTRAFNDLGLLRQKQGRLSDAKALYERLLEIHERVLGPDYPDTATSLSNLATVQTLLGDHTTAKRLHQRALEIRERVLGPDHPDTANSLNNLASVHQDLGDHTTARRLYQRAFEILKRVLGPDHPDTATSLSNLATVHHWEKRYPVALELMERAFLIREARLGAHHRLTMRTLENITTILMEMEFYSEAGARLFALRAAYEQIYGQDHPKVVSALLRHAHVMRALRRPESAKRMEIQARHIEQRLHSKQR